MTSSGNRRHLPHGPRHDERFELEIEALSAEGFGVAPMSVVVGPQREPIDYTFHVRKAVPGDRLVAQVERREKRTIFAHIDEMLEASRMRIEPRCRHFGRRTRYAEGCGGCTYQSLSYRHQLATKERIVKNLVAERDLDPGLVLPVIGQDEPWYYRNKMEFSFGDTAGREFALGLYPKGYHYEVLNLDECYLQSPFSSDLLPQIRLWAVRHGLEPYINKDDTGFLRTLSIREGKRTGQRMVELTTTDAETALFDSSQRPAGEIADAFCDFLLEVGDAEITSVYWTQKRAVRGEPTRFFEHHLYGKPVLVEEMHLPDDRRLSFEIHPRAFFQPNTLQAEVLYAQVLEKSGLRNGDRRASTALDLYCGTGTIGLALSPYAERVVGIEREPEAVENARDNARINDIDNVEFLVGDVADMIDEDASHPLGERIDVVVVDPPRAGLLPRALRHLVRIDPPRIVYVSCNPEALARDLAELTEAGYHIEVIQPVDMFPHTYHVENVVALQKDGAS
ncbi:MAG: 23S rRNA (uracil(1939)-C(5))-methyltransferase RlmD [Persicimonas sp.]